MKKRGGIKGHRAVEGSSLNLSQIGQSLTLSGRGHGRKHRFSTGATNRAARRAAAAEKRKGG